MPDSTYKLIELVGSSDKSWADAMETIINETAKNVRDLRIAEVVKLDVKIDNQKIAQWRVRVRVSFKYEGK